MARREGNTGQGTANTQIEDSQNQFKSSHKDNISNQPNGQIGPLESSDEAIKSQIEKGISNPNPVGSSQESVDSNSRSSIEGREDGNLGVDGNGPPEADQAPGPEEKPPHPRPATRNKRGTKALNSPTRKASFDKKIAIFTRYHMDGLEVKEIAKEFDISIPYTYRILADRELKKVVEAQRQAMVDSMADAMGKNVPAIATILKTYIEEAQKDYRIEATPLQGLFSVYGVLVDRQLKLEELALKREEIRVRRMEAEKAAQANTGLITDFMLQLQNANTLPPREPVPELGPEQSKEK